MKKIISHIIIVFSIFSSLYAQEKGITHLQTDVCIVGAGSGGIGAALAASRAGTKVILIEKQSRIGGTSTMAYVNNWEPGPGCDYSKEIYLRLKKIDGAVGIAGNVHTYSDDEPYGISSLNPEGTYKETTRRSDLPLEVRGSILFDFMEFDKTVRQMLEKTGNCQLLLNTTYKNVINKTANSVKTIEAISASGKKYNISAKIFIDCTGGVSLCRDLGCETMLGAEPRSKFNEPSAPEKINLELNAISLCYQIRKSDKPKKGRIAPAGTFNYHLVASVYDIPGKSNSLSINPLGFMKGTILIDMGYHDTYALAKTIVDDHWAKLQKYPHFKDYEFDTYAPMLGIRESYRVVGEYVLNQNDLLAGYKNQEQKDIIALADHPMDVHGKSMHLSKLNDAYGIPYRCLIPKGWDNLLTACRGSSFSHLAASSARLSRTIMAMGHAAGFAASIASNENIPVSEVPVERIQAEMNLKLRPKWEIDTEPLPIVKQIGGNENNYLITDNGNNRIYKLNKNGEIIWEFPVFNGQDVHQLKSGNILFNYYFKRGDGSIRGGVREVTPDKEIVFQYEIDGEVHSCQRLKNGNTIITDNNNASLIEVSPNRKVVNRLALKTDVKGHSSVRMVRVLGNGNYLVCQEQDSLVVEYRPDGKIQTSIKTTGKCFEAIRLKNGNTLVSNGNNCSVTEFDKQGKEVWKITKKDFPEIKMNWLAGIEELPNGNILVCNWLGHGKLGKGIPMFEVARNKEITWYFTDNVSTKSISNITILN